MNASRWLTCSVLIGGVAYGTACRPRSEPSPASRADIVLDDAKAAGRSAADATVRSADDVADSTRETAHAVVDTALDAAAHAARAVTDGWITAKVKAKVADEIALTDTTIRIDTARHVVTLRGTVRSHAAREKAGEIAAGTEGVTRVVNELVVKTR